MRHFDTQVIPIKSQKKSKPNGAAVPHDWTSKLRVRGSNFVGDEANVVTALREAPELRDLVRYNEFRMQVELQRKPPWRDGDIGEPWNEHDDLDLQRWLQESKIDVRQRGVVSDCIERVARDALFHPVREYLSALWWDGVQRLRTLPRTYLQARGNEAYLSAIGERFFISAVARIFKPGCQADHVLVIDGAQGIGKTSAVRILGGKWIADGLPNLHDKDSALHLLGVWLVELAELAAIRRTADLESTKAFLSRTVDRYRPPYGRRTVEVPRQCVFIATTNEAQYLRDPTGNRRFWPVSCGAIDLAALTRDRDQIWAEAVVLYKRGDAWHLSPDESALANVEQADRIHVSELEQRVQEYVDSLAANGNTETTARDVLIYGTGLNPDNERFIEIAGRLGPQVAAILNRLSWQRIKAVGRSPNRRVTYRYQTPTHRGS